jgi:hypothetical protein
MWTDIEDRQRDTWRPVIFERPDDARGFCAAWAARQGPSVFDVETYDALACPSRDGVAIDPFHPDFRLRGFAGGWVNPDGTDTVAWFECGGWPRDVCRALFDPVFGSPAAKGGFHSHFDEQALVYPGYVTKIVNRSFDPLFAALTLGDGTRAANTLARLSMDFLGESPKWVADKRRMGELPLLAVARGACSDVLLTYKCAQLFHKKLQRGEYI